MAIRVNYDVEQDVEVCARFEIYDEEPDFVKAEEPSDILELMSNSDIDMGQLIEECLLTGVEVPDSHKPSFDTVKAFIDGDIGNLEAWQLTQLIESAVTQMRRHIDVTERANKTLREELDRLAVPNQQTAEGSAA